MGRASAKSLPFARHACSSYRLVARRKGDKSNKRAGPVHLILAKSQNQGTLLCRARSCAACLTRRAWPFAASAKRQVPRQRWLADHASPSCVRSELERSLVMNRNSWKWLLTVACLALLWAWTTDADASSRGRRLGIGTGPGYHATFSTYHGHGGCASCAGGSSYGGYDPWGTMIDLGYTNPCCSNVWAGYENERPWCLNRPCRSCR